MKRVFLALAMLMVCLSGMAQHHGREHNDRGHHNGRPHQREVVYVPCASPEQADLALKTIENQSFDDKKLEIARLCVTLVPFEVRDLMRIAEKFSFDDNRKEFLIYAYPHCCDPENYYALRDCFSFRSNFDEMMEKVQRPLR